MDLSKREIISCPLCNSSNYKKVYKINTWDIVKCNDCTLAFTNPRLIKHELLNIYTSNYFDNTIFGYYHYSDNKGLRKKNFNKWIDDAVPYLKKDIPHNALDIGCATGYCLEIYSEKGWQADGIELDTDIANKLIADGYKVYNVPLIEIPATTKYSIITLFDVVEHLTDLKENFTKLHTLLNDDGIIVLITPNYQSLQRKILGKKWFQFKPIEHINYFDLNTLGEIAAQAGLKIVHHKKPGQYSDINFLENRLIKYKFKFLLPFLRFTVKIFNLKNKFLYIDTASLYVILQKK